MKIEFRKSHEVLNGTYISTDKKGNRKVTIYVNVTEDDSLKPIRTKMVLSWAEYLQLKESFAAAENKHFTGMYRKAQSYFEEDRWARKNGGRKK
ncbi:hypothetical protein A2Z67_03870 [Candidatus Woesebacteria bacterium RBG_13_36_22]|uniref:Uncharacterized protein n=1 Tax=Candidatus Woesebacteria bacterium RBG_13_36_22 TaxID=1802478 RepID=A0A1F7WZB5_9BACT|nr:MAG: hypothetical protein A2Z67_03870 [Candidatus Woesebacteria bacterium RBG_13_36_22]